MEHLQNTFNAQRARGTRQVWFTFREHTAGVRNQQKVPEGSICTVVCIVIDLS